MPPPAQEMTAPPAPSETIPGTLLFVVPVKFVVPHCATPDEFSLWARAPPPNNHTMMAPPAPSEMRAGSVSLFMFVAVTGSPDAPHWTVPAALTFWA